jgi:hypothetical protein
MFEKKNHIVRYDVSFGVKTSTIGVYRKVVHMKWGVVHVTRSHEFDGPVTCVADRTGQFGRSSLRGKRYRKDT